MSGKIEISRELAKKIDDLLYIMTGHDSYPRLIHKYGNDWWRPINDMRAEICTMRAAPVVERQEPDVVALPRKYLISYRTPSGFGRFFNDRQDGTVPSEENIVSMETKLESQHGVQCTILQVTEISACLDKVKELNK